MRFALLQMQAILALAACLSVIVQTPSHAQPGPLRYVVTPTSIGSGRIMTEPNEWTFAEGTTVTLTAEPNNGWSFVGWHGDLSSNQNPITITIRSNLRAIALFQNDVLDVNSVQALVGFAASEWDGLSTTTGGLGGETVVVTTGKDLYDLLDNRRDSRFNKNYPPLNIVIQGTLTFPAKEMVDVKETYNLSILGADANAVIQGFGLNIYKSFNIIVRNIEFRDCPDDAISVDGVVTHHVWIDHCTFSDSPDIDPDGDRHDGLVDIKHGATCVTVSWNRFFNHSKTCLLGHSDNNGAQDTGRLKVTYHHNWFDNTYSRHPRVRFGECHVFNNLYDNGWGGMNYGIASTQEADVVVQANYFMTVVHPTFCGYDDSDPGDIVEFDNLYDQSGLPQTRGEAFNPKVYYSFTPDPATDVPWVVMTRAGAGRLQVDAIP